MRNRRYSDHDHHFWPFTLSRKCRRGWGVMLDSGGHEDSRGKCHVRFYLGTVTLICELPVVIADSVTRQDLGVTADRDTKLSQLGWQRTGDGFRKVYGDGYERVAASSTAPPPAPSPGQAQFSERPLLSRLASWLRGAVSFAEDGTVARQRNRIQLDHDTIEQGAAQLSGEFQALVGPRVKELQTLLDETGDLALFAERLAELANEDPADDVVDSIARATFAARLAGRTPRK